MKVSFLVDGLQPEDAENAHVISADIDDPNRPVANDIFRQCINKRVDLGVRHIRRRKRRGLCQRGAGQQQYENSGDCLKHRFTSLMSPSSVASLSLALHFGAVPPQPKTPTPPTP